MTPLFSLGSFPSFHFFFFLATLLVSRSRFISRSLYHAFAHPSANWPPAFFLSLGLSYALLYYVAFLLIISPRFLSISFGTPLLAPYLAFLHRGTHSVAGPSRLSAPPFTDLFPSHALLCSFVSCYFSCLLELLPPHHSSHVCSSISAIVGCCHACRASFRCCASLFYI